MAFFALLEILGTQEGGRLVLWVCIVLACSLACCSVGLYARLKMMMKMMIVVTTITARLSLRPPGIHRMGELQLSSLAGGNERR